jgi:hypothetical protein
VHRIDPLFGTGAVRAFARDSDVEESATGHHRSRAYGEFSYRQPGLVDWYGHMAEVRQSQKSMDDSIEQRWGKSNETFEGLFLVGARERPVVVVLVLSCGVFCQASASPVCRPHHAAMSS